MAYSLGPHPGPETLEQYALGQLAESEAATIEEHFLVCGLCRNRLEQIESFVAAARTALADARRERAARAPGKAPMSLFSLSGGLVMAAGFALVLIGIVAPWRSGMPGGPTQTVALLAMRGAADVRVSPGKLELTVDTAQLPPAGQYRLQLVNSMGKQVWVSGTIPKSPEVRAAVPPIGRGHYWVRIYGGDTLLREYGLAVE